MLKSRLNKGSALVTALFVITLITIIATAISVRIRNDIQTTYLIETTDRLYLAAQAVDIWAMDRLHDPKQELGKVNTKTGAILTFPSKLQAIYPGIIVTGQLFDLQGRFNLNNASDKQYQTIFYTLLRNLHIGSTSFERKELTDSLVYWLTPPKTSSNHDEWQDKYAKQKPPYFPSHMPMYHPSELRLVYGFSAQYYQKLAPYITTLPEATPINLNTVMKPLLATLGTGIKDTDIDHILQVRSSKPFKSPQELTPIIQKYHIPNEMLTVESHYFLAVATVKSQDLSMQTYVILQRQKDEESGTWKVHILTQSINTP